MTRNAGKLLLVLSLLVGVGQGTASAQIGDVTIQADILAFEVGNSTLPAGKYDIKVLNNIDPGTLEIRSADGHTTVIFETQSAQAKKTPRKTELVFNKVGDRYFLSQIWLEGSDLGNQLPETKAEKRLGVGRHRR